MAGRQEGFYMDLRCSRARRRVLLVGEFGGTVNFMHVTSRRRRR